MNRTLKFAAIAGSSALLAACNDGSLASHAKGKITPQNSQQVGDAISATVSGSTAGFGGGSSSGSQKMMKRSATGQVRAFDGGGDSCYTVSGDQTDADNDGIPVDATWTLSNC